MKRGLSLWLDVARFGAAVVVVVTHLAYAELSGGQLAPWRLVGNDAVMVFFVLSGLVIAHVTAARETSLRDYALSRAARLWSVAVPALALTMILGRIGSTFGPLDYSAWWYQDAWPELRVVTALTFTNELWFASVRPFSNGPWWSLGYEAWYYAIFGAAVFLKGARRTWIVALLCLIAGPKILLLFPIWLLGVAAYRRVLKGDIGPRPGAALFFGSIGLYALFRGSGAPGAMLAATHALLGEHFVEYGLRFSNEFAASYVIGPLAAANFVGAAAIAPWLERALGPGAKAIRWAAGSTFTLYLVHYPLLRFIGALVPYDRHSPWAVAAVFVVTLGVCLGLGTLIEGRKDMVRGWLDGAWRRLAPA